MGRKRTRDVWYEPLEEQQDIDLAVHWVLKRPGIFLNTVGDIHLLPKVLDAASRWQEGSPNGRTNAGTGYPARYGAIIRVGFPVRGFIFNPRHHLLVTELSIVSRVAHGTCWLL